MASRSRARPGRRNLILAAATLAFVGAGGGIASGNGGVNAPQAPLLSDVACVERCAAVRKATEGSKVEMVGRHLAFVDKVTFSGSDGRITVEPASVGDTLIKAEVPEGAVGGKPRAIDEFGQTGVSPYRLEVVPETELPEEGSFELSEASVSPRKSFFYGTRKPTLTYLFSGGSAEDARIDLVKRSNGAVVKSWIQRDVAPFTNRTLTWDGRAESGRSVRTGRYKFRIGPPGGPLTDGEGATKFGFFDHIFPIRGKHSYGDGIGAPRAGHTHQGQDVFASCGTRLVAARGGRVQWKAYHGAAGYYLVIDGKKTDRDYTYMHLKGPATVRQGERVRTGERIGEVGESGNASGCHLHFELWSKPGWYEGGHFLDPTPKLKKWDSWS